MRYLLVLSFALLFATSSMAGGFGHGGGSLDTRSIDNNSIAGMLSVRFQSFQCEEYPDLLVVHVQPWTPNSSILLVVDISQNENSASFGHFDNYASSKLGCLTVLDFSKPIEATLYAQTSKSNGTRGTLRIGNTAHVLTVGRAYLLNASGIHLVSVPARQLHIPRGSDINFLCDFFKTKLAKPSSDIKRLSKVPTTKWNTDPFVKSMVTEYRSTQQLFEPVENAEK